MPQVFVLTGSDIGRSFSIRHGDTVGRAPDCILTLKHPSLSRKHAHFEREGERWFVVDDGSRNGVIVDKQRTMRGELVDGAEFQLGELHLRFRLAAPLEERPAEPAAPPVRAADPPRKIESPPEIELDEVEAGEIELGEIEIGGEEDEPIITAGGGARAPSIRPEGDSPYKAAGPFAMPPDEQAASRRPGPPSPAPRKLADDAPAASIESRAPSSAPTGSAPPSASASARPTPPPPQPVLQHSMLDTGFGRGPVGAAGATISRSTRKPGDRVLQYHKVDASGGADLAQLPAPARWALYLVGALVMAGVAWFAFRGASMLKNRASSGEPADVASDEAPLDADGETTEGR